LSAPPVIGDSKPDDVNVNPKFSHPVSVVLLLNTVSLIIPMLFDVVFNDCICYL